MKIKSAHKVSTLVVGLLLFSGCTAYVTGDFELSQRNYNAAIPYFQQYLAENQDHLEARNKLGFAYLKTGQINQAIQEFEKVLEGNPGNPYATLYLGLAWLKKNELRKAITTWRSYKDESKTQVEKEIQRQVTFLEKAESQRLSKTDLAEIETSINEALLTQIELDEAAEEVIAGGNGGCG
jgi:tetratricopeptide (TPR) repeat protein